MSVDKLLAIKSMCLELRKDEHLAVYESVADLVGSGEYREDEFVSKEQMQKAIEKNSCWEFVVYPNTPVGFYRYLACDLDELATYVLSELELIK